MTDGEREDLLDLLRACSSAIALGCQLDMADADHLVELVGEPEIPDGWQMPLTPAQAKALAMDAVRFARTTVHWGAPGAGYTVGVPSAAAIEELLDLRLRRG